MLGKDQDPFGKMSNVIYQVPCSCGHANTRETKTAHKIWMNEHKVATRRGELEKSDHHRRCLEPSSRGRLGQDQGVG